MNPSGNSWYTFTRFQILSSSPVRSGYSFSFRSFRSPASDSSVSASPGVVSDETMLRNFVSSRFARARSCMRWSLSAVVNPGCLISIR